MQNFVIGKTSVLLNSHLIQVVHFKEESFSDEVYPAYARELLSTFKNAVPKRKAEFITGRIASRECLRILGSSDLVFINPDRTPLWPQGFIGSISHDMDIACAVVAKEDPPLSLGVDLCLSMTERDASLIERQISYEEEVALFTSLGISKANALRLIFSGKESLYKALYHLVRRFIDFKDVRIFGVIGDSNSGVIKAEPYGKDTEDLELIGEFAVHYEFFNLYGQEGYLTLASNFEGKE